MKHYLFSFLNYCGDDRVFVLDGECNFKPGDLVKRGGEYFLSLGEDIAWKDKYSTKIQDGEFEVFMPDFFDSRTLELLHFMVHTYFSTYKKVVNLFVDLEIGNLLRYNIMNIKKPFFKKGIIDYQNGKLDFETKKTAGQSLIVFPDLLTLKKYCDLDMDVLHGSSTQAVKNKIFWKIRSGEIGTLLCTYSQIFKKWNSLKEIIVVDSHKWYYKSQQDPRFDTLGVLEKMTQIYGANFEKYGFPL